MSGDDRPISPAEFAAAFAALPRTGLLLAVSGGPDSTALMHAVAGWCRAGGADPPAVATVDHGLRPGSGAECDAVAAAAARLGLPHHRLVWAREQKAMPSPGSAGGAFHDPPHAEVPGKARPRSTRGRLASFEARPPASPDSRAPQDEDVGSFGPAFQGDASDDLRPTSQASAREARYGLLASLAGRLGLGAVVSAHTLDDQAETLLIRMAAGSGLSGLAGMRDGRPLAEGVLLHRPLLGFPKARLVETCRREGWSFVRDPSNADPRYARPRWRRLLPRLAAEGLDADRLSRLATRIARADAALEGAADGALSRCALADRDGVTAIDFGRLATEPEEIVLRVLARLAGGDGLRLGRLETCAVALRAARAAGLPERRTLNGRLLALDRLGTLRVSPEPARRRGRPPRGAGPGRAGPGANPSCRRDVAFPWQE